VTLTDGRRMFLPAGSVAGVIDAGKALRAGED
jgi:hypothetical protein